jgi:hypothetical protein
MDAAWLAPSVWDVPCAIRNSPRGACKLSKMDTNTVAIGRGSLTLGECFDACFPTPKIAEHDRKAMTDH